MTRPDKPRGMRLLRRATLCAAATMLAPGLSLPVHAVAPTATATATADVKNSTGKITVNARYTLAQTDPDTNAETTDRWQKEQDPTTPSTTPSHAFNLGAGGFSFSGVLRDSLQYGVPYEPTGDSPRDRFVNYLVGTGVPRETARFIWALGYTDTVTTETPPRFVPNPDGIRSLPDKDLTTLHEGFPFLYGGGLQTKIGYDIHTTDTNGTATIGGFPIGRVRSTVTFGGYSWAGDLTLVEGFNELPSSLWDYGQYGFSGKCASDPIGDEEWWRKGYIKLGSSGLGLSIQSYAFGLKADDQLAGVSSCPGVTVEKDPVYQAFVTPNDPHFAARGTWGQAYSDQWALHKIGFTPLDDPRSAWHLTTGTERPVKVAVIDSGIDLTHPDIHIANIWFNEKEIPGNGRDDDDNGYIDDVIGWNFVDNSNNPADLVGHGTHTAGLIAARWNNGRGIAGINRGARIMVLKALNDTGRGWGSDVARAILYAVDNGAQIINISAGYVGHTKFMEYAYAYAREKGVLVVVAAGNHGRDTREVEPANQPGTLVVTATQADDRKAGFSNWGQEVSVAAPGVDVLSLRARGTDLVRGVADDPSKEKPLEGVVGGDKAYYRASGTSFSAPLVSGLASLIWAKYPRLTAVQVARMIVQSARDIELPGWDQYTGYGLVDARAALTANPDWYLDARIARVEPTTERGRPVIQVFGSVSGSDLGGYVLELGQGEAPSRWKRIGQESKAAVQDGLVGTIPISEITARGEWTIRVVVRDKGGAQRESRATLTVE
ncbi:MAG: S8 family serine peptidase [candidate division NC10 bacterium]|nr:S8 family serine peptidase [candidate division NC10 bacterium]